MPAILLVTASFFCYFAGSMNDGKIRLMSNFIYIYPMILSMRIVMLDSFPRRQTFLFRRGGRNGSWGPFMALGLWTLLWTGLIGAIAVLANLAAPSMPTIPELFGMGPFSFVPPRLSWLCLVPLFLAGSFFLSILFSNNTILLFVSLWMVMMAAVMAAPFAFKRLENLSAMTLVSITVGLWAMVVLALWYRCFRCDLGGPGRGIAVRLKNRFGTRRSDRALPANRF